MIPRKFGIRQTDGPPIEVSGKSTNRTSPFAIYRNTDGSNWGIALWPCGFAVTNLLPEKLAKSKGRLDLWMHEVERDLPAEVAMLHLIRERVDLENPIISEAVEAIRLWSEKFEII